MTKKDLTGKTLKCFNCGNNLVFSPEHQALFCDDCKTVVEIEKNGFVKHDYNAVAENASELKEWNKNNSVFTCSNCGANVIMNSFSHSETCPYCSTPYVKQTKTLPGLLPDCVIPFAYGREQAAVKYAKGVHKKWFLPNQFKKKPPVEEMKGIYIPVFSFDADSHNVYNGRLANDDSYTDLDGRVRTHTSYKNISGVKDVMHKDITVESSSQMNQLEYEKIKPYETTQFTGFNENYLRGYAVEYYNNTLNKCKELATTLMREEAKKVILSKYIYDRVESFSMTSDYSNEKYCYQLLPMYKFSYTYKNKSYTTFMNGQTGKVGGGLPVSGAKITGLILGILFAILMVILILNL